MADEANKTTVAQDLGHEGVLDAPRMLQVAKIAEAAERYQDMCKAMKELCALKKGKPIEKEERNLLSVAYKNVIGTMRASWRTLNGGSFEESAKPIVAKFKASVEEELLAVCAEVNTLLEELVDGCTKDDEAKVFYLKMKGDYHRYKCEIRKTEETKEATNKAYQEAMTIAEKVLEETHPTRLGLALNYSVCYYEIMDKSDEACKCAKKAFDAAIEKLDTLNDASYKDSTLIMQLLRDNLTLWTSENENQAEEAGDK